MRWRWAFLLVAVIIGLAAAGRRQPRQVLAIGAMPPGTSWYVFAATLGHLLEDKLPSDIAVEIMARGSGIGNATLVERRIIQIGLSQVATAVWARAGHPTAYRGRPHPDIRALVGGLNSVWITAMLREEYISRTGNDTLEKALRSDHAPRIVMKPPGSTVPIVVDMILEFYGTSREGIRRRGGSIIQVGADQIPDLLRDGRADLYFETAIRGHPTVTEAATTADVRFLDFSDDLLAALAKQGMRPTPMPVWFKGQRAPTKALDCGTVLIAHKDMPDDLAYLITKTLCENRGAMVEAHKAWADFEPEKSGRPEATGIPLHTGSERYYRERGWL